MEDAGSEDFVEVVPPPIVVAATPYTTYIPAALIRYPSKASTLTVYSCALFFVPVGVARQQRRARGDIGRRTAVIPAIL